MVRVAVLSTHCIPAAWIWAAWLKVAATKSANSGARPTGESSLMIRAARSGAWITACPRRAKVLSVFRMAAPAPMRTPNPGTDRSHAALDLGEAPSSTLGCVPNNMGPRSVGGLAQALISRPVVVGRLRCDDPRVR